MGEKREWILEGTDDDMNPIAVPEGPDIPSGERVVVAPVEDLEARCREVAKELRFDAGPKKGFAVLPRSTLHALADKLDGPGSSGRPPEESE